MKRALLGSVVVGVTLGLLFAPQAVASHCPASASEHGIGFPDDWDGWDSDNDCFLSEAEMSAAFMGSDQNPDGEALAPFKDWAQEQLEENGGDFSHRQMRDWIRSETDERFGPEIPVIGRVGSLRHQLGIADEGNFGGDRGDDIRSDPLGELSDAAQGVAGDVAGSAVAEIANTVGAAAGDLVGRVGEALSRGGGATQLESDWYQYHYSRMLGWAGLLMLPLAMLAIGAAVVRGQTAQVGETLLQIPIAYALGVLAVSLVTAASGLAQAMTSPLAKDVRDSSTQIGADIGTLLTVDAVTPGGNMGPGLVLLLGLAIAFAALVTLVWLVLAEAAIYGVVLFAPLAFAGRVWPQTASWGRKLLTTAFALVASKVVIFALWALALSGVEEASEDTLFALTTGEEGEMTIWNGLAVTALLMLTAFSPLAVLRLVPMVEGAQAAGDPRQAISRGKQLGQQTVSTVTMMTGAAGRGGGRLPVSAGPGGPGGSRAGSSHGGDPPGSGKPLVDTSMGGVAGAVANRAQTAGGSGQTGGTGAGGQGSGGQATSSAGSGGGSGAGGAGDSGGGRQVPAADPPGSGSGKPWRET